MRTMCTMILLAAIGCAGGGDGGGGSDGGNGGRDASTLDPAQCTSLRNEYETLVNDAASRSCTVDADCVWIQDACFGPQLCYTFVNVSVRDQANALVAEGKSVCQCAECLAMLPACKNGVCGPKQP